MKIKEVEKKTGLTARAIRLYEAKDFIRVPRRENGYREYDEDTVRLLREIRFFRMLGASLSDIRLYTDGVLGRDELLQKRRAELKRENNEMLYRLSLCDTADAGEGLFDEDEPIGDGRFSGKAVVGIDIGTTTLSAVVFAAETGERLETYTVPTDAAIPSARAFEHIQSVETILQKTRKLLSAVVRRYRNLCAIGITGQMHGIVYLDRQGNAVSDLYTWEDRRGDERTETGIRYIDEIYAACRQTVPSGYGIATHYYNLKNGLVPPTAVKICTVMDYIACTLTGNTEPRIHPSDAAALGLFDIRRNRFDGDALCALGIPLSRLPAVQTGGTVGCYEGIPVAVAIGDNQATFLGSVAEETDSVLLNYGTGGQVSVMVDRADAPENVEVRPYVDGKFLLCGSSLCGGRAYALLERFFRLYVEGGAQYDRLNELAERGYGQGVVLDVDTAFCGKRDDPSARGRIDGIGEENFTPEALACGVLYGMANELYRLYRAFGVRRNGKIIASGNAVRKNPVLRKILSEVFGMDVYMPQDKEEAAFGAGLFALSAIDDPLFSARKRNIRYTRD